jgi:hypothetical protein
MIKKKVNTTANKCIISPLEEGEKVGIYGETRYKVNHSFSLFAPFL